jgi:hypothetical protein
VNQKQCSFCKELRPIGDFSRDRVGRRADGLFPHCRACVRARQTKWRETRREYLREYWKQWRDRNVEKVRAGQRARYAADPRVKEQNAAWGKAHPEVRKAVKQNRRARERSAGGKITGADFKALCERYGNRCLCCGGEPEKLSADHVIPLAKAVTPSTTSSRSASAAIK